MFQYYILESVVVYCCRTLPMFQYYILESVAVYCCRPLPMFQLWGGIDVRIPPPNH
jgi:hypothetical protein